MRPRSTPLAPLAVLAALALAGAGPALGATGYTIKDHSTQGLISEAAALAIWADALPETRLAKLYPVKKWGFLSQVEGGLISGQTCVVTARAVMLPLTSPTRRLVWEPVKTSTTYDSRANLTAAQCSELASDKLKEAVQSLVSGLIKS